MSDIFHIRIAKPGMVFSAAHFITFNGDVCERLHGHNYHVAVEIHGPLDENHYVVDFIAVRDRLQAIVLELDHHVLLPTDHSLIRVAEEDGEVIATFRDRKWVFPADDCVLLPVANTTAELLARYIGGRLSDSLRQECGISPERIRVEVDECEGQVGVWEACPG